MKEMKEKVDKTNDKAILEARKYLAERLSKKEEYTIEEAKSITKDFLKRLYDSFQNNSE